MEVITRLYVGNDALYERLKDREGWSWLRCCKYGPGGHKDMLGYTTMAAPKGKDYLFARRGNHMALNLIDSDDPNYIQPDLVNEGLEFIKERMDAGDKVLVACNHGSSRSPTTALMYLRTVGEMPHNFVQSEKVFRTLYPNYDPGQGMRQYARAHWSELNGIQRTSESGPV